MTSRLKSADQRIRCRDLAGHRQDIIVLAHGRRVLMVVPPGATAVSSLAQTGRLRATLRKAIEAVLDT